jgi:hypothetical protein
MITRYVIGATMTIAAVKTCLSQRQVWIPQIAQAKVAMHRPVIMVLIMICNLKF